MSAHPVNGPSSFALRGRSYGAEPLAQPLRARRPRRAPWLAAILLLLALAGWQLGGAAWIQAKALLAQHLIASSWAKAKAGEAKRPWPWADTHPVARLTVPSRGIELYVLAGTSGRSLAFGPGHVDGTAAPGSAGNSVIVAHRDTHFAFLRTLHEDEEILVEDALGRVARYRVRESVVVDKHATRLLDPADSPQLTLITCWPFDALQPGTDERFVVIAERLPA
ncbi:MAG: class GN sortase [Burkholderiales bacterium]